MGQTKKSILHKKNRDKKIDFYAENCIKKGINKYAINCMGAINNDLLKNAV